jgi:hypothetical protein
VIKSRRSIASVLALTFALTLAGPALAAGKSSSGSKSLLGKAWSWVMSLADISEENGYINP